jgi:hypothetical protein
MFPNDMINQSTPVEGSHGGSCHQNCGFVCAPSHHCDMGNNESKNSGAIEEWDEPKCALDLEPLIAGLCAWVLPTEPRPREAPAKSEKGNLILNQYLMAFYKALP